MFPKSTFDSKVTSQMGSNRETTVLELVCRNYTKPNVEAYYHYAICLTTETVLHSKEMKWRWI